MTPVVTGIAIEKAFWIFSGLKELPEFMESNLLQTVVLAITAFLALRVSKRQNRISERQVSIDEQMYFPNYEIKFVRREGKDISEPVLTNTGVAGFKVVGAKFRGDEKWRSPGGDEYIAPKVEYYLPYPVPIPSDLGKGVVQLELKVVSQLNDAYLFYHEAVIGKDETGDLKTRTRTVRYEELGDYHLPQAHDGVG